jgi:predicted nucleotidyltransferase
MNRIYQINEIREKLQPVFASAPVYRAILFGSYAMGLADEHSDVDIVIDSRGELHGLCFFGVLEDAVVALDKRVDLIEMSEIQSGSSIMSDIRERGVVLYER